MIKYYIQEMFEPTLLYGLSLAALGICASFYYGHVSLAYSLFIVIGTVMAQMSVNVISDYFDYSSGLDKELVRGKSGQLSGGSSLLANGKINPQYTLAIGLALFAIAGIIGIYLLYVRIQILPILVIAALSILLYAKYAKKVPYLSEPLCTINYTFIALGSFVVISGVSSLSYALIFSFIPAGIMLGGDALFVNEVPDRAVDKKYGVRHSAVMLRTGRNIGLYYLTFQLVAYLMLVIGILLGALPMLSAFCLITLPTTAYVFNGLYSSDSKKYGVYLKTHTLSAFAFALILSVSYILGVW